MRVLHFLAVSDAPFELRPDDWINTLSQYRIDGRRIFDQATLARYRTFASSSNFPPEPYGLESGDVLAKRIGTQPLITDDNMGDEWRWHVD
jgi:hypothetical protein